MISKKLKKTLIIKTKATMKALMPYKTIGTTMVILANKKAIFEASMAP